jgi:hypothetical protein
MANIKVEPVSFHVPSGEIQASLLGENATHNHMTVVLPGAGYSCKQPLLYFLVKALLASGHQVLTIDSLYANDKKWLALPTEEERYLYVQKDAESLFQQIQSRFKIGVQTIIARSLGTYALACALEKGLINPAQIVWQCPSLHDKWPILQNSQGRGLVIIGDADPRYKLAALYLPEDRFVVEDADHSMEVSDPIQSINLLKQITEHTQNWLQDSHVDMSQLDRNSRLTPEQRLVEHQAALQLCDELARAGRRKHG